MIFLVLIGEAFSNVSPAQWDYIIADDWEDMTLRTNVKSLAMFGHCLQVAKEQVQRFKDIDSANAKAVEICGFCGLCHRCCLTAFQLLPQQ